MGRVYGCDALTLRNMAMLDELAWQIYQTIDPEQLLPEGERRAHAPPNGGAVGVSLYPIGSAAQRSPWSAAVLARCHGAGGLDACAAPYYTRAIPAGCLLLCLNGSAPCTRTVGRFSPG